MVLVVAALWATALLIYDLIKGIGVTNSPSELLAEGGLVWLGNNVAFALLYWLMTNAHSARAWTLDALGERGHEPVEQRERDVVSQPDERALREKLTR